MTQAAKCGHSSRCPSGGESGGLATEKGQVPSRDRIVSVLGLEGGTEPGLPDQHRLPLPPRTVCPPTARLGRKERGVSIAVELHTVGGPQSPWGGGGAGQRCCSDSPAWPAVSCALPVSGFPL